MSLLQHFKLFDLGAGIQSSPPERKRLEGSPEFTTWPHQQKPVQTGVWAATPGIVELERDSKTWEQFYILEGEIEITEEGREPRRFAAGDSVVVEPNFRGTWRTIVAMKKIYIIAQV